MARRIRITKKQAQQFVSILSNRSNVLLSTHTSPDGDAIASLLAAREIVRSLNSNPICCLAGQASTRYDFLPGFSEIINPAAMKVNNATTALIVDCGNSVRIGEVAARLTENATIVNIDHHEDNHLFGILNLVYPEAASTTEILYELTRALGWSLDQRLATCLYTGLFSDTGSFRYSNTDSHTLAIAAELVEQGAKAHEIASAVYHSNSPSAMQMIAQAISSLEFHADGAVALMSIQIPENGDEVEDLVDYALSVRNVQAAVLLRINKEHLRVSLRGRGAVNVAGIARKFGGGGHPKAAGFIVNGDVKGVRDQVLKALCREVENNRTDSAQKE